MSELDLMAQMKSHKKLLVDALHQVPVRPDTQAFRDYLCEQINKMTALIDMADPKAVTLVQCNCDMCRRLREG